MESKKGFFSWLNCWFGLLFWDSRGNIPFMRRFQESKPPGPKPTITLPETNSSPMKSHHFDGIYQDFDGDFPGRTVSFREGNHLSKC